MTGLDRAIPVYPTRGEALRPAVLTSGPESGAARRLASMRRLIADDRAAYSRFQVLCAERPAWARPALRSKEHFYFDGRSFWRRPERGRERLLPSWRAPRYGWVHESWLRLPALRWAARRRGRRGPAS